MINWRIQEESFDPERISHDGNKFLTGNGYMGIRGTLPEYEKEQFVAVNLAGIYDQVGDGWREPLNAPNGLYTYVEFQGNQYRLPAAAPAKHSIALDYRHGVFHRATTWETPGGKLTVKAERFASMKEKHLLAMKYCILCEGGGEVVFTTGIDGRVWDINGPHYDEMLLEFDQKEAFLQAVATTHESGDKVVVSEHCTADFDAAEEIIREDRRILRRVAFLAKPGVQYVFCKYVSVYTGKDTSEYIPEAVGLVNSARDTGYALLLQQHTEAWEKLWDISEITIEGDDPAMEALNYSMYHLHCIAPRHTKHLSIAARGLSGQTYKGAVFWDTEMFMLDFFLFTEPAVAKTLLKYRIDTLEGAKKKAKYYGFQGAFYAWESQEGGYDACSDYNVTDVFTGRQMRTYFKDKQIHISAAIVHGIMRYVTYTGSFDLLAEGGAEVILECARFYYDLLLKRVDREYYELHDVIGPDEYHERVNNNAYTNRMAKFTFDSAVRVLNSLNKLGTEAKERIKSEYDTQKLLQQFSDAARKLFIPKPDSTTGVIEQFDGYEKLEDVGIEEVRGRLLQEKEYWGGAYGVATHTKVIKQADVVTMLNLFSADYSQDILLKNWEYYEPRTEHGSSLSACMYAVLACKCHKPDRAYPFFMKSALSDISGKGKEWAGLIYIGGTHPASSGGAYMTAVEGFAGLHAENGELKAASCMPAHWTRMEFHVIYLGRLYRIEVTQKESKITDLGEVILA